MGNITLLSSKFYSLQKWKNFCYRFMKCGMKVWQHTFFLHIRYLEKVFNGGINLQKMPKIEKNVTFTQRLAWWQHNSIYVAALWWWILNTLPHTMWITEDPVSIVTLLVNLMCHLLILKMFCWFIRKQRFCLQISEYNKRFCLHKWELLLFKVCPYIVEAYVYYNVLPICMKVQETH